ncbi:MAG: hypothetical protein JWM53_1853 [bacterium]|nr:hypothetical protein [bacterium]
MCKPKPLPCDLDLRSTLEAMDDLAFVFDAGAQPIFVNQAALRTLGFSSLEEALADIAGWGRVVRVVRVHPSTVGDIRRCAWSSWPTSPASAKAGGSSSIPPP